MSEVGKKPVSRRGLIRRAGTVAAGAGVASVAAVAAPSPALAADVPVNLDVENAGSGTTTISTSSPTGAALKLATGANTPPLVLDPVAVPSGVDPNAAQAGTVWVDNWGNFNATAHAGGTKFNNLSYSPTWAWMPVPYPDGAIRWVDTRYPSGTSTTPGRTFVSGGDFDGAGRLLPKGGNASTPDAIIHVDELLAAIEGFPGIIGAVQANLTVVNPTAGGFISLYGNAVWPETSSLNFGPGSVVANFTQTWVKNDRAIRVKLQAPAIILLDISGFVAPSTENVFSLNGSASAAAGGNRGTSKVSTVPRLS